MTDEQLLSLMRQIVCKKLRVANAAPQNTTTNAICIGSLKIDFDEMLEGSLEHIRRKDG